MYNKLQYVLTEIEMSLIKLILFGSATFLKLLSIFSVLSTIFPRSVPLSLICLVNVRVSTPQIAGMSLSANHSSSNFSLRQ